MVELNLDFISFPCFSLLFIFLVLVMYKRRHKFTNSLESSIFFFKHKKRENEERFQLGIPVFFMQIKLTN